MQCMYVFTLYIYMYTERERERVIWYDIACLRDGHGELRSTWSAHTACISTRGASAIATASKSWVSSFLDETFGSMPLGRCMICTNACFALSALRISVITLHCDFLKPRSSNQLQKVTSCTWPTRSMPAGACSHQSVKPFLLHELPADA